MASSTPPESGWSSPPGSSASDDPPSSKKESTGDYLEQLSETILDINLNMKDPWHPLLVKHISPDMRGKHDALPKSRNREDHQAALMKHLDVQPNFHMRIFNHSSEVDDSRGRATVYIWYEITGLEHGLARENVAVLSWERKQGIWMITKHQGMRGPSGFHF